MKVRLDLCLCAVLALAWQARAQSKTVPLDKVPPAVWKTLQTATGGLSPKSVERTEDEGEITYEAVFTPAAGGERSAQVAEDGQLLSLEVTLADVPEVVKKAIAEQIGDGDIDGIDKQIDGNEISYDVDFTPKAGGSSRSLSLAADGTLLSREVTLEEVPTEVQKTIKSHIAGGTLEAIDQVFEAGEVSFDVDYTDKKGKEVSCSVTSTGHLLSVDVLLEETPAPVQATIKDKIGAGKVIGVSKVFNSKHSVVRYEVEGAIAGKAFDFSVGTKGKFLGMDS